MTEAEIYREALVFLARDAANMRMTEEAQLVADKVGVVARDALARGDSIRAGEAASAPEERAT
jgi:hypothetical protein